MPVVNITATVTIEPQNLALVKQLPEVYLKKKKVKRQRQINAFSRVVLSMPTSKVVFLVNASGKCVCLGARSAEEVNAACEWLCERLSTKPKGPPVVRNIVYSYRSAFGKLSLEELYNSIQAQQPGRYFGSYSPELYAALIYQPIAVKGVTALIFRPGAVNITGLKCFEDIEPVLAELGYILNPAFLNQSVTHHV